MNLKTFAKSFHDHNLLSVEVGTNCPRGGDGGHGGRTVLCLGEEFGPFVVKTESGEESTQFVKITMEGDAEGTTFFEALKFAVAVLEKQRAINSADLNLQEFVEREINRDQEAMDAVFPFTNNQ